MKPLVSIVMAYHNRKSLLYNTLRSISVSTKINELEIIIVDDGSSEEHRLLTISKDFNLNIKVIRLEPEDKWYSNPCVPFNIGFKESQGDIVVIQNPECMHVGDIVQAACGVVEGEYLSFHAYSLNEAETTTLKDWDPQTNTLPFPLHPQLASKEGVSGYYNHHALRPAAYHFCSAIRKKDLEDLNGFDERYAEGIAFDDDEFITRVKRKGLQIKFIEHPLVLHQNHYVGGGQIEKFTRDGQNRELIWRNHSLFHNHTLVETEWRAKNEDSRICSIKK